jgi:hypothetical protein
VQSELPALRGAAYALCAAVLFGVTTPFVQLAGAHVGAWMTAALLYAGAAPVGVMMRSGAGRESALRRGC